MLLPGRCVVCNKASRRQLDLCPACELALPRPGNPCPGCALPLPPGLPTQAACGQCLRTGRIFKRTVSACAWEGPVRDLVGGFKYQGKLQCGRVLGKLLLERLREEYRSAALPGLLLPVPLHPRRLRERGFNQSLELARQLGDGLGIPVAAQALARTRATPAQQGLPARERRRNLRNAFAVREPALFAGQPALALVDDVVTTMSTVRELARVLRQEAPDAELHVWTLARA